VHFIGFVNVVDLKAGGLGRLGPEQLASLEDDIKDKSNSTPIVVFAHIPLWTVYADWGWGTDDGLQALDMLKRFGSVTVLNGHIHQIVQKVEGNMTFHTARSTCFGRGHGAFTRANDSAGRSTSLHARHHQRRGAGWRQAPCHHRHTARKLI
jgi:3',5'-cyclic AMP phosphodiesterase CpdA